MRGFSIDYLVGYFTIQPLATLSYAEILIGAFATRSSEESEECSRYVLLPKPTKTCSHFWGNCVSIKKYFS